MIESISKVDQNLLKQISQPNTIIEKIGNTPLIRLTNSLFEREIHPDVKIYGKAEWYNPGGSVKDRPAWNMVKNAIESGLLTRDQTIIDASSGNTGIALAMIGAALRIKVEICIPKNASKERLKLLKAYGANIILTDPLEGTDGAIIRARELVNENRSNYYYIDQYNNEFNWKAHYEYTAEEIIIQTNYSVTHFIAGLGTSGTFTGITRKLKEKNNNINCIALQPESPFHGLEGLKHMETAMKPSIYDENLADGSLKIHTKEAQEMTIKLARREGILVGTSSGANVVGAGKIAEELNEGIIVTILCDRGERYLNDRIWE